MSNMDHGYSRKRFADDASSTSFTKALKKPRVGLDIETLSPTERAIIAEAAAILEVPLDNLPAAITTLGSSSGSPINHHHHRRPRPRFPHKMGVSKGIKKVVAPLYRSDSSSDGWEKSLEEGLPTTNGPEAEPRFCGLDTVFGFEMNPAKWSDCFGRLTLPEQSHSYSNGYSSGGFSNSVTQYDSTSSFTDSSLSTQISSLQSDQRLRHPSQTVPMTEQVPNHDLFACDLPYAPLLQNYPVLRPVEEETIQPLTHKQEMTYPNMDLALVPVSWHQNMGVDVDDDHKYFDINHESASANLDLEAGWHSDDAQESEALMDSERSGGPRRGPFRNLHDREQTAQTRKLTACVRCRMQRIRCIPDPFEPHGVCLTCKKVSNMKLSKLPCLRYKITEIKLFKPGQVPGMEWTRRWSNNMLDDISTWASQQTKKIQVTEGYSSNPLELEVGQFVTMEGDMLHRKWVASGVKKQVLIPPYAIVDLATAEKAFMDYINRGGADFFKHVLDQKDKLLWDTYSAAIERANSPDIPEPERLLLKMVLRLWVAIRITTRSIRIAGDETLGMSKDILDETSPLHGSIPIPPVMGAQIELILIQKIQVPLRIKVLDQLQKLILANKSETWFTIYLCIFILLHNCAMITKHDAGYARKHGIQARFARPAMVAEYHMGANILLAYFHYCNKGLQPFALDGGGCDLASMARLNERQMRFIQKTREYVKANESRFEELKWQGAFENDQYFIAQLFEEDWKPRITV